MAEAKLTAEEAEAVRAVLSAMVIKTRTGEVGICHGADRFVSTGLIFNKPHRQALDAAARKLGLGGIKEYGG